MDIKITQVKPVPRRELVSDPDYLQMKHTCGQNFDRKSCLVRTVESCEKCLQRYWRGQKQAEFHGLHGGTVRPRPKAASLSLKDRERQE